MDDESGQSSSAGKQSARWGSWEDGPDTVRILPDSSPTNGAGNASDDDEWRIERPVVRSGTLYPRVPAEPAPQQAAGRAIEPAPTQSREVVSAGEQGVQSQAADAPQQVTVIRKGPSACAIIAATLSLLMLSCAVL